MALANTWYWVTRNSPELYPDLTLRILWVITKEIRSILLCIQYISWLGFWKIYCNYLQIFESFWCWLKVGIKLCWALRCQWGFFSIKPTLLPELLDTHLKISICVENKYSLLSSRICRWVLSNDISPTHTTLVKSLSLGNVILYKKLIIGYKDANMIRWWADNGNFFHISDFHLSPAKLISLIWYDIIIKLRQRVSSEIYDAQEKSIAL